MTDPLLQAATQRSAPVRRSADGRFACLVLIYPLGAELGQRFDLSRTEMVIGRGTSADINLTYAQVSRRHAQLARQGDSWYVLDLGSTNGTFVNGRRVEQRHLGEGDLIAVGNVILKFLAHRDVEKDFHDAIFQRASRDALTGAASKGYFLEQLERELAHCGRTRLPLSLVLLDIDHFKQVNDAHGHLVGDQVLKAVAVRLQERIRTDDLFARYGGEEFVVLLRDTSRNGALALAAQLCARVAAEPFEVGGEALRLTMSAGVATVSEGVSNEVLLALADSNLYHAKQRGRNRVVG